MRRNRSGSILDFFKRCPECGKRFHVRLVSKQKARVVGKEVKMAPPRIRVIGTLAHEDRSGGPVTINLEEFLYNYKCKGCGHEWSEKRVEKHVEKKLERSGEALSTS